MAQTLQQLIDLIKAGGVSRDAKRVDDAVIAFSDAAFIAFGYNHGDKDSGIGGLTCRQVIAALGTALKNYRIPGARQDAFDRAFAILERESR